MSEAEVRKYALRHDISEDYVETLLAAVEDDAIKVGWVATIEPYHGPVMLALLRGAVRL